jgi:predicted phosphoribosyltransferase/dienelactone hydrolase
MAIASVSVLPAGAQPVLIPPLGLPGHWVRPAHAEGLVLVVQAGWPERQTPRLERMVAALQAAGLATLSFDLFTAAEAADRTTTYDLKLMSERVRAARAAVREIESLADLPVCLLGLANGAAAVLQFATLPNAEIAAIACCGGRPDLARDALPRVRVPTLLLTGDRDEAVLDFNRAAWARLESAKRLSEIAGVGQFLEGAAALDDAAAQVSAWFLSAARAAPKPTPIAAAATTPEVFAHRAEAGRLLALRLLPYSRQTPVVLALPRGGVPVGAEIARALQAPLDVVIARKIGLPWEPELAIGAIAEGAPPEIVLNEDVLRVAGLSQDDIARLARVEMDEMVRRQTMYRRGRAPLPVEGATAILVDDGLATGATMRAAVRAVARRKPARLVLAVPVAAPDRLEELRREFDDVVCLRAPAGFRSVGQCYRDFSPVGDETVVALLAPFAEAARNQHT